MSEYLYILIPKDKIHRINVNLGGDCEADGIKGNDLYIVKIAKVFQTCAYAERRMFQVHKYSETLHRATGAGFYFNRYNMLILLNDIINVPTAPPFPDAANNIVS